MDQAKERERKPYDRRFYGEIKGNVPLEDKAMVESQGSIVDRTLEQSGHALADQLVSLILEAIDLLARGHHTGPIREVAEPEPKPNEALVAVHAFSLNRGELRLFQVRPEGWAV